MAKLENICEAYQAAGLYTHVYVSCGFLSDDKNLFEFSSGDPKQTIYDLSSLTKALVTTPLVLWRCATQGLDPRQARISELFGAIPLSEIGAGAHDIAVANYLRHETGLPFWRNFYVECLGHRQTLAEVLLRSTSKQKSKEVYSDVGFLVLGELIQRTGFRGLIDDWYDWTERFALTSAKEMGPGYFFDPSCVIPTGYCPVRERQLCGEVHDENCWALGGFTGHAGLFASGESVSRYLRDLWQVGPGRLIYEENFREIASNGESLMGWRKGRDASSSPFADGRGCGHLGFTGTAFWVDPLTQSYAVVLTNRVISGRVSSQIKSFRAEVFGSLWEMLQGRL